jgi:alkylation response protein AidB-like acyl-CoA dehydrogenase
MIEWSDDQLEIRRAVRDFVTRRVQPRRDELELSSTVTYEVLRDYFLAFGLADLARERFERDERGTAASNADERYERAVLTLLPMVELCRESPGLGTALGVSTNLAGNAILRGTKEQRRRWALPLLTLERIGAWAITEPDSGSDALGGMRASASRDGDEFVLNGTKTFITNGPFADTTVFICKLNEPDLDPRARPILSFVLDRGMPGFDQSPPLRKMGLHSSPTGQLFVDEVRVGFDRLIGGEATLSLARSHATSARSATGRSPRASAVSVFTSERASTAAMALGIIEQCLETAVGYAKERIQFGRPIAEFQLVQSKLASMEIARINVSSMLFRYLEFVRSGRQITLGEASAMKLYSAGAAVTTSLDAVQVLGGNGYMYEYHVEQLARDAKVLQIYGGTDEIQTLAVARDLLTAD